MVIFSMAGFSIENEAQISECISLALLNYGRVLTMSSVINLVIRDFCWLCEFHCQYIKINKPIYVF